MGKSPDSPHPLNLRLERETFHQNVRAQTSSRARRADAEGLCDIGVIHPGGKTAPRNAASTSRRGIPAWGFPSRERPGIPHDAASSFGTSARPARQVRSAGHREEVEDVMANGSEDARERWVGRDRGPKKNDDRDLQLVVRSRTPLVGDESGQNRTTQPETGKYRNRQNISDVYRLLPTVLNSLEILLLSEPIATMAPRAMRAAIRAYSIRSWPDSSFIRFLKSSFITVLLVNSRTVIH